MSAEQTCDVAAVRYLNDVTLDIPSADFERSVDILIGAVQERLSVCQVRDNDLSNLQQELAEERSDSELSRACYLQARAGIDPGDAPSGWLKEVEELSRTTGSGAIGEVMALLPEMRGSLKAAREGIENIRRSTHEIDLSWLQMPAGSNPSELPWQRATVWQLM